MIDPKESEKVAKNPTQPSTPIGPSLSITPVSEQKDKIVRLKGIPRGVYRFKTHEEADEWWEKMLKRQKE